jgi:hypothetical protein
VVSTPVGRPRIGTRTNGHDRRLSQQTTHDGGPQVYTQDPFTVDTGVYGPDAYYEVSVDPPMVVPVTVGGEAYSVRVAWLRKFWNSCEYQFYFTPPGSNPGAQSQIAVSGELIYSHGHGGLRVIFNVTRVAGLRRVKC